MRRRANGGLLLTSLLYRRAFAASAFERAMLSASAPIWGVSMTKLDENLFIFRFDHMIDLKRFYERNHGGSTSL